jgi:ABC-type multidrug transport system fused ATPase/permease subunit
MPPLGPRSVGKIGGKPKNFKKTLRELAFYYRNYKKLFIVAIVLAFIGACAAVAGIIINGYVYSQFIIPSAIIPLTADPITGHINYNLFGLISFI